MSKKKTDVSDKRGRGKPRRYGDEITVVRGFALPPSLIKRLVAAAKKIKASQSSIVVAAVEEILSQSPDRLADAAAARKRPAVDRLRGGWAE